MGRNYTPPFTVTQQKVLAIVPKVTSVPSILGSLYVIQHVARSAKRRQRLYHRILFCMSAMDLIFSIKTFLSTWIIPEGVVWGAVGTTQSCTAAGFFGHGASLSSAIYNCTLTLYFLLNIRYGWTVREIRRKEFWLHAFPLVIAWSTAIAGLPLDLFNPIGWTCWIGEWPPGCGPDTYPCQRGENADIYRWAFFHAELWAGFGFVAVAMLVIYAGIRRQEKQNRRYQIYTQRNRTTRLSRQFATQASLYVGAFFLAWIWPMVMFAAGLPTGNTYFPLVCLTVIFAPLQGFLDAIIYVRPRYLKYRQKNNNSIHAVVAAALSVNAEDEEEDLNNLANSGMDSGAETALPASAEIMTAATTKVELETIAE